MKLKIDHKTIFYLDDKLEPKDRLIEVENTLKKIIKFDDSSMTIKEFLYLTFNNESTSSRKIMENIGTYLSKMPEQEDQEDKNLLSTNQILEMEKGIRRTKKNGKNIYAESRYKNFVDLSLEEQSEVGISIITDETE